jgi:hypothetical protein
MFELKDEETLMISDDGLILLTSHRVIQKMDEKRNQILLEDFENIETRETYIGNYRLLTVVFTLIAILLILLHINNHLKTGQPIYHPEFGLFDFSMTAYGIILFLILSGISLGFFLISKRNLIRINGRFNHIEFRVTRLNKKSVSRFLNALKSQSELIKSKMKETGD